MDTAEDDDGLDGIVEKASIFDKRRFSGMGYLGLL